MERNDAVRKVTVQREQPLSTQYRLSHSVHLFSILLRVDEPCSIRCGTFEFCNPEQQRAFTRRYFRRKSYQ